MRGPARKSLLPIFQLLLARPLAKPLLSFSERVRMFQGEVLLITGGTGSFGNAVLRGFTSYGRRLGHQALRPETALISRGPTPCRAKMKAAAEQGSGQKQTKYESETPSQGLRFANNASRIFGARPAHRPQDCLLVAAPLLSRRVRKRTVVCSACKAPANQGLADPRLPLSFVAGSSRR